MGLAFAGLFACAEKSMPAIYTDRLNGLSTSTAIKAPVRLATFTNITLSGLQSIDGVTTAERDRVLVKSQDNAIQNGIWLASERPWTRAHDFDGSRDAAGGTLVVVTDGTINEDTAWRLDGTGPIDIGVDEITFSAFTTGSSGGFPISDFGPWEPSDPLLDGAMPDDFEEVRLTLSRFGIIDSPSLDQTASLELLASYVNATARGAAIYCGPNKIKFSRDITFTKSVKFIGDGVAATQFISDDGATLYFDGGDRDEYTGKAFVLRDLGIATLGVHSSQPLHFHYNDVGTTLRQSIVMQNVEVAGADLTDSFINGILIENAGFVTLQSVRVMGPRSGPITAEVGIKITGTGGTLTFINTRTSYVQTGFAGEGEMEGIVFSGQCELTACFRGITWEDTTGGFQPFLTVSDTHIAAESRCIKTIGITEFNLGGGCDFYGVGVDGSSSEFIAIDITPTTSVDPITVNGKVVGGFINAEQLSVSVPGIDREGIRIRGAANPFESFLIDDMGFRLLTAPIVLDANSNSVVIGEGCSFDGCDTPYVAGANGDDYVTLIDKATGYKKYSGGIETAGFFILPNGVVIANGTASPEGAFAAPPASLYLTPAACYRKSAGTGTTGWVSIG